jgi:HNH endonuclease
VTSARISLTLRREVRERAKGRCEYCLLPEEQAFFPHEPDHILAMKHGGQSVAENLALACFDCNRFKGSDIASIDPESGELTRLFDPRTQEWTQHFSIDGGHIKPRTASGRVTELVLKLNLESRVEVREILAKVRRYDAAPYLD